VALSDAARQTLTDHAATLTSAGLPAEVVEGDRLRELEPFLAPDIACGLYSPGDAQVDPWRLVRALARAARRLGAAIVEKTRVESVRAARGRVQAVVTAQGEVAVPVVVNCLGAWGRELAGAGYEHLPIEPQRGHLLVTEPAPPTVGHVILGADYVSDKYQYGAEQPGGAAVLGQRAALALALEQTGSGNLLIGSSRELAGHDPSTGVEVLAGVARRACRYLPRLKDLHLLRCFAGLRPHTPHGLPFVGPMPECDGAYIAAGHCGDGICLAPVTGQIVAEMIVSGRPAPGELAATAAGGCRGV
jgi:sarcosine oxidase subunit beta